MRYRVIMITHRDRNAFTALKKMIEYFKNRIEDDRNEETIDRG